MALELGGAAVLCLLATLAGSGIHEVRREARPQLNLSRAARADEEIE
jgi:hypothetical protein